MTSNIGHANQDAICGAMVAVMCYLKANNAARGHNTTLFGTTRGHNLPSESTRGSVALTSRSNYPVTRAELVQHILLYA